MNEFPEDFYEENIYDDASGTYRSAFDFAEEATYPRDSEEDSE